MFDEAILRGLERVVFVSCGTSYQAGILGRYAIEEWARMRVEVISPPSIATATRSSVRDDSSIGISQSGETADTLAAMRLARGAADVCWP